MKLKRLVPLIGIIILIGIIYFFDPLKILAIFAGLPPLYAGLSFFAVVPVLINVNIVWQILLKKQKIHVGFWYSMKNILIGFFYGFITPGGFGAFLRAYYLREESKVPLPKCISNIITYNSMDFLALLLLGVIGGIFLLGNHPHIMIALVVMFVLLFSLFVFFLRQKTSKSWFNRLLKSRIFAAIQSYMDDLVESFYEDLPSFKDILLPFMLSIWGWMLMFTEMYLIGQLFSISVPFFSFVFSFAIANIIATIPISIYGLGTRDATLLTLFTVFAVIPERVISFSLFWFIIFWLTPSVLGGVVTFVESRKSEIAFLKKE